jgi:hypothetical protein
VITRGGEGDNSLRWDVRHEPEGQLYCEMHSNRIEMLNIGARKGGGAMRLTAVRLVLRRKFHMTKSHQIGKSGEGLGQKCIAFEL